ncbi:Homeobox protein KNOX3 [Hordeum vulgare]|nr:Homeobox protein KNOX3 [Hordeum vulgare]
MVECFPDNGATTIGFGRRHLHEDEARLLYEVDYPAPSETRVPGLWRLSIGGVPVSSSSSRDDRWAEIARIRSSLPESSRNLPRYAPTATRYGRHTSNGGTPTRSPPPTGSNHAASTTPRGATNGGVSPAAH